MRSEQKTILGETGQWLRIGTLALATLTPLLSTLASRLPKRIALVINEDDVQAVRSDLKSHPYSQKLRQSGGDLTDTLKERASDLTHSITERGDELSQALVDRRDDLSYDLRKRGKQVRRAIQKQNRKLQKKWQKQFQRSRQEINRSFWITLGFGSSLTLAAVITYQLIRRRLQHQREEEEATSQLSYTDINTTISRNGKATNVMPPNVTLVGITSTKLYYPIETPLDQLSTSNDSPVDVIYFLSAQEASKQGFKPATSHSPTASSHADRSF